MKKFYVVGLALASSLVMSQEVISFETGEGFTLGTLHNQKGWTVTEGIDGYLENQIITDTEASDENYSFMNGDEPEYDFQWFPMFGAAKEYDSPFSNENFIISYDVMVTEKMGADFEFTLFSKDEVNDYYPIAGVGMEYQGNMYVISSIDYDYEMIEGVTWEENTWYNIKVEINPEELKYYVNDELVFTGENYNVSDISGFNMLHNNYGGSAYYDNIQINPEMANVKDMTSSNFNVYPNPVKDVLSLDLNEKIVTVEIYSLAGQKIKTFGHVSNVQVSDLTKGSYIVKIQTESGIVYTKKFVKN
jgi:hypothetical protein